MYTVRKLRNLAKLKLGQLSDRLMFSSCILLKKGLLMNENSIYSLKNA